MTQIKKEANETPSTPPKPGSSQLKMSISNNEISLDGTESKSVLESLNTSNSSLGSLNNDTLDKLSEIHPDEYNEIPTVPLIEIPDNVRVEAGQHWRLKEAILNSFYFEAA